MVRYFLKCFFLYLLIFFGYIALEVFEDLHNFMGIHNLDQIKNIFPFTYLNFFIVTIGLIFLLHAFKHIFNKSIPYKNVLFVAIVSYLYFLLPNQNKYSIPLFFVYIYMIYWVCAAGKYKSTLLLPVILIVLPMVFYKIDIGPISKILGISYITFRATKAITYSKRHGVLSFIEFIPFLLLPLELIFGNLNRSYRFQKDVNIAYVNINLKNFIKGWDIFIIGLFFKFIIAELSIRYWLSQIDLKGTYSVYAYTLYLFDFAGYSAMAVGISLIFGISMPFILNKD